MLRDLMEPDNAQAMSSGALPDSPKLEMEAAKMSWPANTFPGADRFIYREPEAEAAVTEPEVDPAVRVLVDGARSPEDVLAEDQEQEWDQHRAIIAAVTKYLPGADVEVRREMRSRRNPSLGCTVKTISYVAEIDGVVTRADTYDRLKVAAVTQVRDAATVAKLEREQADYAATMARPDRFETE